MKFTDRRCLQLLLVCLLVFSGNGLARTQAQEQGQALRHYVEAERLAARNFAEAQRQALVLFNLAFCQDSLGNKQRAVEIYEQVLLMLHAASNRADEASTLKRNDGPRLPGCFHASG
ncbi:MAG TPA: hypothetical protein VNQ79_03525 [Blastocatellia bacterium]|nr:hypothetical protein [Blastocatellia bacterium]